MWPEKSRRIHDSMSISIVRVVSLINLGFLFNLEFRSAYEEIIVSIMAEPPKTGVSPLYGLESRRGVMSLSQFVWHCGNDADHGSRSNCVEAASVGVGKTFRRFIGFNKIREHIAKLTLRLASYFEHVSYSKMKIFI